jgi:ParB/RepB/Spo0J family partition protein
MKVSISQIRPNPFQVRTQIDPERVQALAKEIKILGYWGGLRARKNGNHYELCFGHRRLEALKILKVKEIDLELVDLSDDEMAKQALVENLQREGLNDLEKAHGFKLLMSHSAVGGIDGVASLVGLSSERVRQLLGLLDYPADAKRLVERGQVSGAVANQARAVGGFPMIATAAKHALSQKTLQAIQSNLLAIPEPKIREKVQRAVISGKVLDPESVREHERKIRRDQEQRDGKRPPPDLKAVIRQWTQTMEKWAQQLDAVLPYLDYIETDETGAAKFKAASRALIDKLKRFL